jgi:two-component system OmpR family sensor kinase
MSGLSRQRQALRRLRGRVPLRVKLISAVLTLVVVALAAISVAGVSFMGRYLLGSADATLRSWANPVRVAQVIQNCSPSPCSSQSIAVDWLPAGGKLRPVAVPVINRFGLANQPQRVAGPAIEPALGWLTAHLGQPTTLAATSGGHRWRVIAYGVSAAPNGPIAGTVIVGVDVTNVYETLGKMVSIDLIVSAVVLVALAIIGVGIVRTSLRPLTDIERTAEAIAAGDLSRRITNVDPNTEVGRLARSLNLMLSQIEAAFDARSESEAAARGSQERLRRFVADASHELRTPLTAIRGYAEYYRQRGGLGSADHGPGSGTAGQSNGAQRPGVLGTADMDRIMLRVEQESSRMSVLVEDMLLLARLDQQRPVERKPVDLLTLAADAVQDARIMAPSREVSLSVASGAAFLVLGDEARLRQVIGNLMSNALAHTPDGTRIDVRIRAGREPIRAPGSPGVAPAAGAGHPVPASPPAVTLEVADQGPGLSAEQAERVFERFYRADQARGRQSGGTGGTGLGLAIVDALVTAHGGTVGVESAPGRGATFRITLPLAPEALPTGAGTDDDHP